IESNTHGTIPSQFDLDQKLTNGISHDQRKSQKVKPNRKPRRNPTQNPTPRSAKNAGVNATNTKGHQPIGGNDRNNKTPDKINRKRGCIKPTSS
ncbi:MAG: hypothetical protein WCO51_09450, partial [bacterium]